MKKILGAILSVIVLALLPASCLREGERYSRFHTMADARWIYGDTLRFDFSEAAGADSTATPVAGDLLIVVRHSRSYPYSNIWLELGDATGMRRDTLNILLADVYGRRLGHGLGTDFQRADTVARGIVLADSAEATLTLRNIIRTDTHDAIEQIGMIFIHEKNTIAR